ncbi:TIGR04282 family arsenosugar biosynthesis glycosyltransferase [Actinoplanes sp. NPDC049596]|uniref:TIGR04282 family arsenosugar biosynthesis glycosyltransferase n=1 Tax=unclassified Actinoplanes TaxID=2626549 RepID=UPI00341410EC
MIQLLVMAKAPVPGRVKTRLCPPCTPDQAAAIAAASLADTLTTTSQLPAVRRVLVLDGTHPLPPGWSHTRQRGRGLAERLRHAFADTHEPGVPSLLIGMDTPQLTTALLHDAAVKLHHHGSVLGPAADGGWWALGLADPTTADVLAEVPMSTPDTAARTLAALSTRGVHPALLPQLRDVDTASDAGEVAALCPPSARFPAAVARHLPGAQPVTTPLVTASPAGRGLR